MYSFHYNHDTSIEDAAVRDASEQARALIDKMRNTVGERYTGIKVVIANQQNYDENRESYTVTDDLESNSGKMQKAKKLGIPIKTYGEFGSNKPKLQQFDFNQNKSEELF